MVLCKTPGEKKIVNAAARPAPNDGSVRVQGQLQLPFLSSQCEKNCRSRPPLRRSHNRPEPTSVSEGTRADACSQLFQLFLHATGRPSVRGHLPLPHPLACFSWSQENASNKTATLMN